MFAEDHRQPVALTALAGIGKTVLAKSLTADKVAQREFPDGIVWITAGKETKRDFIEEMREILLVFVCSANHSLLRMLCLAWLNNI